MVYLDLLKKLRLGFGHKNFPPLVTTQSRFCCIKLHQDCGWFLVAACTQNWALLITNFAHSLTPLQPALRPQKLGTKLPKIWFENTSRNRTPHAPKPLSFSIFFFIQSPTWDCRFLERENGQNLAAFSEFFSPKTDCPWGLFIGKLWTFKNCTLAQNFQKLPKRHARWPAMKLGEQERSF